MVVEGSEQRGELGWGQAGGTVVVQRFLRCGVENITGVLSLRLSRGGDLV